MDGGIELVVAITGASGAAYAVKMLELLRARSIITHLIVSVAGRVTLKHETGYSIDMLSNIVDYKYDPQNIGASIASGSYRTSGMIIVPCSMNTLSSVAHSREENLISRVAGVTLKERRKLVLMTRETPLHTGQISNMLKASEYGAVIAPITPALYNLPSTIEDMISYSVGRILDLFGIEIEINRWNGLGSKTSKKV